MKNIILILLAALMLTGCFEENNKGCPTDMRLKFILNDRFEEGDYDSRIENEVLLYIFKDKKLTYFNKIPYDHIKKGEEYVIRKTPDIAGNLNLVAWAVPKGESQDNIPDFKIGDKYEDLVLAHDLIPGTDDQYQPYYNKLYFDIISSNEAVDEPTSHTMNMGHAVCRIEVNVQDQLGDFREPLAEPHILFEGAMSKMNLNEQGVGSEAIVKVPLISPDNDEKYTTQRFGVLPSGDGQTISVQIINKGVVVATLTVPATRASQGAEVGGLLIFDYVLYAGDFFLTIDGFTEKIFVDEM